MKSCPVCRRLYPNDAGFCPADGSGLRDVSEVSVLPDPEDPRVAHPLCGRYHVRRIVADGGMGRVYEAHDVVADKRVAVKVLLPQVADDDVAVQRFKREFEVSKLLPHDHIVEVHDFQETGDGTYALVMEFLEGEELRNVLKRDKRVPPERVVRMVSHVALGLDEAHKRELVHRDLKPDNLFLCGTADGDVVKILDFGSVKDKSMGAKKLTMLGTTIGSPYYMAPEQAQGLETLDARADVWALAAIVYECLTGGVPFKGNNGPSILLAILTKDPTPPSQASTEGAFTIPTTVDDVMEVALAKNPAIRTKSVGQLADDIGRAFGLAGDHRAWARMSQAEIAHHIAQAATRPPQPVTAEAAAARAAVRAMDGAFASDEPVPDTEPADGFAMGVPSGPPKWLVPAIVAAVVVIGGVVAALALR